MSKKCIALILGAVLLLSSLCTLAQAANGIPGLTIDKLSTRTGPGTQYTDSGTYSVKGQWINVLSRAWDSHNGIWWVKCEIPYNGEIRVLWTGYKRFDSSTIPLDSIPIEGSSSSSTPSYNGGSGYFPIIGQTCVIYEEGSNTRSGPGTGYAKIGRVERGSSYVVCDYALGDTNKDWYQIRTNNGLVWISSMLVNLNGNRNGTINGQPILGSFCRITAAEASVCYGPGIEYGVFDKVSYMERYRVVAEQISSSWDLWYMIEINGKYGWVPADTIVMSD